jgi:hypothetical protein
MLNTRTWKRRSKLSAVSFSLNQVARAALPASSVCGQSEKWGGGEMDFQIHEQTYFLSLAEDEKQWEVFVSTPDGPRAVPVYVDAPKLGPLVVLQEEKQRMPN